MVYRVCDQEGMFSNEGNSTLESDNEVILQLELSSGVNCYSYRVTASDGTNTVVVDGRVNQELHGKDGSKINFMENLCLAIKLINFDQL